MDLAQGDGAAARSVPVQSELSESGVPFQAMAHAHTLHSSNSDSKNKRRKQSKPVRYGLGEGGVLTSDDNGAMSNVDEDSRSSNASSRLSSSVADLQTSMASRKRKYSDDENGESDSHCKVKCPHCGDGFPSEDMLRVHIEEEHVQKLLEKQLQQSNAYKGRQERELAAAALAASMFSDKRGSGDSSDFAKNFQFPQMPPLVPISQGDSKITSMMPLGMFSSPMASFLFPGLPSNTPPTSTSNGSSSASGGSGSSSAPPSTPGGLRIFNPEAYCELCNKEFCNKYFLRTHKANKHGIYSVESLVSSPGYPGSNNQVAPSAMVPHSLFPSGVQQMLAEQQQLLALTAGRSTGPQHQQQPGIVNMESFCEICQKEFCNKYFLKKHKQKIHGITVESTSADSKDQHSEDSRRGPVNAEDKSDYSAKFSASAPTPTKTPPTSAASVPVSPTSATVAPSESRLSSSHNQSHNSPESNSITGGGSLSALQSVFTPEKLREMGVINPDAFCEICCREFCNKYFLRTHKANKHGIPDPFQKQTERALQDIPENLSRTSGHPDAEPGMVRSAADFDLSSRNGEYACDVCNRSFSNQYLLKIHRFYNHNIPYVKQEDQQTDKGSRAEAPSPGKKGSKDEDGEVMRKPPGLENDHESEVKTKESQKADDEEDDLGSSSPEDAASQDLQKLQSMIRDLTATIASESRVSCNVCRSEFDNKYFLRAHMMNEHGVLLGDDGSTTDIFGNSPAFPNSGVDSEAYCEICQKEFCSKYFLRTHKQNIHGINMDFPPAQSPVRREAKSPRGQELSQAALSLVPMVSAQQSAPAQLPGAQQQKSEKPVPIPPPPPSSAANNAAQRSFVTGRNYCNICNKELCNKYFMKTHMLKMHGINLDEQPADAAKNSIIGGVTCEICQKELCSKYFLKVHKQNTHGIYEDPPPGKENSLSMVPSDYLFGSPGGQAQAEMASPAPPGSDNSARNMSQYTEVCPLCDRRFKSIKWLKTHMINDHSDMLKENVNSRFPDPASALLALMPPPRMCVVCGQAFPDKVALQIHLIKEHRTSSEELGLMNLSSRPSPFRDTSTPSNDNSNGSNQPFKLSNGSVSPSPSQPGTPLRSPAVAAALQHALQGNASLFKRPANGAEITPPGTKVYHCSYCVYSTRWLSNLYAHEKRHTGVNMDTTCVERRFICRICHRAYRFNHSLQRHMISHRASKTLTKVSLSQSGGDQPEDLSKKPSTPQSDCVKRYYRCSRCSQRFASKELCQSHIQQAHAPLRKFSSIRQRVPSKPHKCRICGFATRSWNVLKIHITKQHQSPQKQSGLEIGDADPLLTAEVSLLEHGVAGMAASLGRTVPPVHTPPPGFHNNNNGQQLPMTYVIPQSEPTAFILQPFLLDQRKENQEPVAEDQFKFVPSLVYLPVCRKVSQPMTVAFTLTPA